MSCMHGSGNVTGFLIHSLCFENIDLYYELMHGSDNMNGFSVPGLCFQNIDLVSWYQACINNIDLYIELYAWFRQCDWFLSTKPMFSEHSPL